MDKALTTAYSIYEQLKEAQPSLQDSVNELLGFSISHSDTILSSDSGGGGYAKVYPSLSLSSDSNSREEKYDKAISMNYL